MIELKMAVVKVRCRLCKVEHTVICDGAALRRWQQGELIQRAFPEMDSGTRELLISRTCETCWDRMFGGA